MQVATNGERAKPDWTHCCFSCGVRSLLERVLCKKPVNSFRNSCTTFSEAEESSELYSVSGKHLQRRVHSLQLKIEGCAELKTTTSPALSSECGSVTSRTPCPCRSALTLNVLVSLVFYNWYFISYVVTFWLQGLSILIVNAVGFKKKNKELQLYRPVQLQSHRHVAFLLCFHLFQFSMWFIREHFC